MQFCEKCGAKTMPEKSFRRCTKCGSTYFQNPKAAVAVILYSHDKQQLLLGVRAREPQKGTLDSIGGFLDTGENFETALYRELKEESGLTTYDIMNLYYIGSSYDAYDWEGVDVPVTSAYFMAQLNDGAIYTASDDIEKLSMHPIDALDYDNFAWDGLRSMVRKTVQLLEEM
ncbi:NUDIX domain-containing protein [bacterium]|nr:NUDIX domain-containing protein [bacterium]NBX98016.1 NUDIX domain-containing protein [bacterium]NDC94264.1 NUDIX domain-containing protein [bacterium]NDD84746.1 NUDIX domain-containing protein [bacterium]NDG30177.1 NUDIX domain-containing protein [bacterium]